MFPFGNCHRNFDLIGLAQVIRAVEIGEDTSFKLESLSEYSLLQLETFVQECVREPHGNNLTAPKAALRGMAVQLKHLSAESAK